MSVQKLFLTLEELNNEYGNVSTTTNSIDTSKIYELNQDESTMKELPWKKDAKYFKKTYISSLALIKMATHADLGGNIEVMGMMTGKIINDSIVVMDAYPLPVEGTETRVNAQAEGYEYMVQYLDSSKKLGRNEHIVGWYHSHPGYGCWLSGIDVATQSLNQNFQDPYLAVVIDPTKTKLQGKVEIGAFRTYPENYMRNNNEKLQLKKSSNQLPQEKRQDFGAHFEDYYSLDIEIFSPPNYDRIQEILLDKSWMNGIIMEGKKYDDDEILEVVNDFMKQLKTKERKEQNTMSQTIRKRFDYVFEEGMKERLLIPPEEKNVNSTQSSIDCNDEYMQDESDLGEDAALDESMDNEQEEEENKSIKSRDDDSDARTTKTKRSDLEDLSPMLYQSRQRKIQQKRPISKQKSLIMPTYSDSTHSNESKTLANKMSDLTSMQAAGSAIAINAIHEIIALQKRKKVFRSINS